MINLNNNLDINNKIFAIQLEQLDLKKNVSGAIKNNEQSKVEDSNFKEEKSKQTVTNILEKLFLKDDIYYSEYNNALEMYDFLTNIRLNIAELMNKLSKADYNDIEYLEELDKESNTLIDDTLLKFEQKNNTIVIDIKFANIFLDSLNKLKDLRIQDDEYLYSLKDILLQTQDKENSYWKLQEDMYEKLLKNSQMINQQILPTKNINTINLSKDIVKNKLLQSYNSLETQKLVEFVLGFLST